ncbi:MAG: hypothetical protein M2R45_00804 [Verrucomicrobia subdivision 3 bacterium]|nr:hypothetical protein [Limisphaerales bacterium]MCS1413091.1 hypothetical protein [Limisphaerales bacterium]
MIATTQYTCKLATTAQDIEAAQELRFQVFNMEMDKGFDHSYLTHLDQDRYDPICSHLVVRDLETGKVVGTYRLQTGTTAEQHLGYYSEQEFDFQTFEPLRHKILELGRACIHQDHRNLSVLNLLWKQIAQFAKSNQLRFLIGCSSLTSQDPNYGLRAFELLSRSHLAHPSLQTRPKPSFECVANEYFYPQTPIKIPKLLRAYLSLGAKVCGPPAIDQGFKTIDFLTIMDLHSLAPRVWRRYLS